MSDKETGSFYTPQNLVDFMIKYIEENATVASVLEPSAGDGIFLKALHKLNLSMDAIEIDNAKVDFINNLHYKNVTCLQSDFLEFDSKEKYDLIIGNPPYINNKGLTKSQLEKGFELADKYNVPTKACKNLWVSFVLKSLEFLSNVGTVFFVLPYEFLQVDYATPLRNFLETKFMYIDIIVFNEKPFKEVDQEICLVFLSNDCSKKQIDLKPYISLKVYNKIDFNSLIEHQGMIERNKPIAKWSNSILTDEELDFLCVMCKRFSKCSDLFTSIPGIVTAANDFFILRKSEVDKYHANGYIEKVVSKSFDVGNKLYFEKADYEEIVSKGKKAYVLYLTNELYRKFPSSIKKYLRQGKKEDINKRYKCTKRKRWYDIRLGEKGSLLFFKRYHIYPRLIINNAMVYTTDIAYNVFPKDGIWPYQLAFNFYNSLTLTMCEFNGRFYGGGVCELTPSEFKSLPIPNCKVTIDDVKKLDNMLRSNETVENITEFVDNLVLKSYLLGYEIEKLQRIKQKLLQRRLRVNV